VRQLTSLDAEFLALEDARTVGHVAGLAIYEPGNRLTADAVRELIAERLHLLPPFRWRLAPVPLGVDNPYWIEDPDFDLEFHVRDLALPPPGDDRQLADQVARIASRPLDRARPLWELYVIHGLAGDRTAMLTKMHHAAVDGMSGAEVMSVILDPTPEGRDCGSAPDRRPDRMPSQLEMLGRGLLGLPRQPLRALGTVPQALAHLPHLPVVGDLPGAGLVARATRLLRRGYDGELLERPKARAPRTRFNGRISPHRRLAFGSLSLTEVKAIKAAFGVTVNDVVVALCATALRNWLLRRDELPEECLVAMVPVSVRTESERGEFGNRVSALFVPIPTAYADPRERLERAHEIMSTAKTHHQALPATLLQDMTHFVPPALAARAARVTLQLTTSPVVRPLVNCVISNVPGPREPLYCAGAQLCANYPVSVITNGAGLNITVLSYRDSMDFGIVCDREQMQDPWELMDDLRAALDEYRELTSPPPPARFTRDRAAQPRSSTTAPDASG